jgi:hypothetical protein
MTVAELIDKLRGCPQDMPVVVKAYCSGYNDICISEEWIHLRQRPYSTYYGNYYGMYADADGDRQDDDVVLVIAIGV